MLNGCTGLKVWPILLWGGAFLCVLQNAAFCTFLLKLQYLSNPCCIFSYLMHSKESRWVAAITSDHGERISHYEGFLSSNELLSTEIYLSCMRFLYFLQTCFLRKGSIRQTLNSQARGGFHRAAKRLKMEKISRILESVMRIASLRAVKRAPTCYVSAETLDPFYGQPLDQVWM